MSLAARAPAKCLSLFLIFIVVAPVVNVVAFVAVVVVAIIAMFCSHVSSGCCFLWLVLLFSAQADGLIDTGFNDVNIFNTYTLIHIHTYPVEQIYNSDKPFW